MAKRNRRSKKSHYNRPYPIRRSYQKIYKNPSQVPTDQNYIPDFFSRRNRALDLRDPIFRQDVQNQAQQPMAPEVHPDVPLNTRVQRSITHYFSTQNRPDRGIRVRVDLVQGAQNRAQRALSPEVYQLIPLETRAQGENSFEERRHFFVNLRKFAEKQEFTKVIVHRPGADEPIIIDFKEKRYPAFQGMPYYCASLEVDPAEPSGFRRML